MVLFAMLLACIVFSSGGGPDHKSTGFQHWKHEPWREYISHGPVGRLLAFWVCMINTCFAYTGAEVVGASFGEVSKPKESIPRAVRLTALRIVSIYVGTTFILTLTVSPDSELLTAAVKLGETSGGS
jgi:yeast amino acid transporter